MCVCQYYKGDYDTFEKVRSEQLRCAWKDYNKQQEKIAHETEFINKFRANKKLSSMVQSRIKGLNKMEKLEKPPTDFKFRFRFPDPEPLRKDRILELSDVSFGYDKEKKPLFKHVDVTVDLDSRIGSMFGSPDGDGDGDSIGDGDWDGSGDGDGDVCSVLLDV